MGADMHACCLKCLTQNRAESRDNGGQPAREMSAGAVVVIAAQLGICRIVGMRGSENEGALARGLLIFKYDGEGSAVCRAARHARNDMGDILGFGLCAVVAIGLAFGDGGLHGLHIDRHSGRKPVAGDADAFALSLAENRYSDIPSECACHIFMPS